MPNEYVDYFRQAGFRFSLRSSHKIPDGQQLLRQYYEERKIDETLKTPDYDFCWACVGLLTYGQIDVLDDLINHLPPLGIDYGGVRIDLLSQAVVYMIPLPEHLNDPLGRYIGRYRQEFRDWFYENEEILVWNEAEGRFNLKQIIDDKNPSTD